MKKYVLTLLLLLPTLFALADSRITKTYQQRPLSDVLIEIDEAAPEISISFIYNKLEDYTVTCTIQNATPIEAIQQAVGFYPICVAQKGATVIVEPQFDTKQKLVGRVVDERGNPLEFANVTLFSPTDNSIITGGVTNAGGDFVIPCTETHFTAKVSYVGYETLVREIEFPQSSTTLDIGTFSLKVDPQALAEVKVESDLATTSAEKSTYYPSSRHKNAATDAVSLLHHMMIPQLRLNPLTGYVTTLSGASVTIFIDHIPASADDLAGMNTQDVKRVEILDFPSDVRFQGKPHVINFVMQKYETGGYTKISSTEIVLADFTSTNSVYSKLAHKNWTFDANLTGRFSNKKHMGMEKEETFRLPTQTVTRTETVHDGKQRTERNSASLRATYSSEKMQLANRFEFLDEITPKNEMFGNVTYHPALLNATKSAYHLNSHEITPTYKGDWYFFLPKSWSLNLMPELMFMNNMTERIYKEGDNQPTENHIKENICFSTWQALLSKTFGKTHTLTFINYGDIYNSKMNYTGSTITDCEVYLLSLGQGARYSYSVPKFRLSTYFVYCYSRKNLSGIKQKGGFPAANLSARFSPNDKNSLLFQTYLINQQADGAKRNPTVLKENELMYYSGNASLEDFPQVIFTLEHTWMASNKFTMATFARQFYYQNYYANVWQSTDNGTALLRKFDNVGNLHITSLGTSLTLRLANGNLQFSASPKLNLYNITNLYDSHKAAFLIDLCASYYLGQFYFMSGYKTSEKTYDHFAAAWCRTRSSYYLTTGWGNKHWKAKLEIINPFRTDWHDTRTTISTPLYSQTSESFNSSNHQHLNLTLTYVFNYGKKVKQGNELGTASGGHSSIL